MKSIILRTGISIFFLVLLYWMIRDEIPTLLTLLSEVSITHLCIGGLMMGAGFVVLGWRLNIIFNTHQLRLSLMDSINITYVGLFFNNFLPTSIGGDVVKAICAGQITGKKALSFLCVFVDRVVGLLIVIAVPSLTAMFLLDSLDGIIIQIVYGLLVISILGVIFIMNLRKISKIAFISSMVKGIGIVTKIEEAVHEIKLMFLNPIFSFKVFGGAILTQSLNILAIFWMIKSLGIVIQLPYLFISIPLVYLFSMIPSINGLGVREIGFVYFFKADLGDAGASAVALMYLFYLMLLSVVGGFIYMIRHDYHVSLKKS